MRMRILFLYNILASFPERTKVADFLSNVQLQICTLVPPGAAHRTLPLVDRDPMAVSFLIALPASPLRFSSFHLAEPNLQASRRLCTALVTVLVGPLCVEGLIPCSFEAPM